MTLYETDYRIVCVIAFIERSRLGKTIYELSADHLKVSGKRFLQKYAMDVELRDVSSNIDRLSQRVYRPAIFLFGIGSLQAVVAVGLCLQKALIAEAVVLPVEFLGLSSVCAFIAGSRWISRLEVAKFKSTLGAPLFFLIKEKVMPTNLKHSSINCRKLFDERRNQAGSHGQPRQTNRLRPKNRKNTCGSFLWRWEFLPSGSLGSNHSLNCCMTAKS